MVLYKIAKNKDSSSVSKHYSLQAAKEALYARKSNGIGEGYHIYKAQPYITGKKTSWERIY